MHDPQAPTAVDPSSRSGSRARVHRRWLLAAVAGLWVGCAGDPPAPPSEPTDAERCARGEREACVGLDGPVADLRACALGDGARCWQTGLRERWAEAPRVHAALHQWRLGCRSGHAPSCAAAADLRMAEGAFGAARAHADSGCAKGSDLACSLAEEATALDAQAADCASGAAEACPSLCARSGVGCETARTLLIPQCEAGEAHACTWLGTAAARGQIDHDPAQANTWLWEGCDRDDPWGCLRLAHRLRAGQGPNPSPKSQSWLFTQVCDLQLDLGCAAHSGERRGG